MGCRRCATLPGVFADGTAAALGCLSAGGLQRRILTHYALFGLTFGRVGLQHLEHATGEERLAVAHGLSQSFEAMLFIGEEEDVAFGACVAVRVSVCVWLSVYVCAVFDSRRVSHPHPFSCRLGALLLSNADAGPRNPAALVSHQLAPVGSPPHHVL